MRSGVGPAKDLRALGIDVVTDLPVGQRLQDHPFFHSLVALAPGHQMMTDAFSAVCGAPRPRLRPTNWTSALGRARGRMGRGRRVGRAQGG
ncbi:GMC family oxidoreductase N-terminal domain-containing protein [Streptomyces mirabilis]|nr:GMC family oxidoreductase N-terminal domain-containing protein [Streptomyces mirabilis]